MERQLKSGPVNRQHQFGSHVGGYLNCLLWFHVNVLPGRVGRADLDERQVERFLLRYLFSKTLKIDGVSAEEDTMTRP